MGKENKHNIIKTGFPLWEKKEYDAFVFGLDRFGRNSYDKISEDLESKTPEEVEAYAKAFFARANELPDGAKVIKNLEKKEKTSLHYSHATTKERLYND